MKKINKKPTNTKTMSKIERVKIKNDLRLHISKTYGKKVLNNFAGSEQEDICLNIILNFIEHLQMTEYSENTINVSYISEEEYLRVKIDELLPSKELQRYFYNKLTEVFEMGLSRDAFDANNSESVLPYLDLEVAKEMVNHIKSKLTETEYVMMLKSAYKSKDGTIKECKYQDGKYYAPKDDLYNRERRIT